MAVPPARAIGRRDEAGQGVRPEEFDEGAQRQQAVRVDRVQPPSPLRAVDDEPGVLQHSKVLGDRRPADRKAGRDLHDGLRSFAEAVEDRPPGGVAERVEYRLRESG